MLKFPKSHYRLVAKLPADGMVTELAWAVHERQLHGALEL